MSHSNSYFLAMAAVTGALLSMSFAAWADHGSPRWTEGQLVIESAGCPIETPDALSLMIAVRPGGPSDDLDIAVIDRSAVGAPWGPRKILEAPINSTAQEFCPAPFERSLYFVSSQGACGGTTDGGDIHLSRQSPSGEWSTPVHLPCAPNGPNTPGTERSPSFVETWYGTFLFFSTNQGVAGADEDIYVSFMNDRGEFGRGYVVHALSTPDHQDQMPTVRDLHGVFEVTFNSNRPGTTLNAMDVPSQDAYHSRARILPFLWSKPQNAGPNVNTGADETRASLSWDGKRLYVGRGNVYVSERR